MALLRHFPLLDFVVDGVVEDHERLLLEVLGKADNAVVEGKRPHLVPQPGLGQFLVEDA